LSSKNNTDEESAKGAYFTEAVNQLLVAVNCPQPIRPFLDCLIGYADGKIDIAIFDVELGRRTEPNRGKDAATKWVQRNRKKLVNWQNENKVVLVECKHGFLDRDKRPVPSRYYIHLTDYVNRVLDEAQKDLKWWNNYPHKAIESAAQNYVSEILAEPIKFHQRANKPKDIAKDISKRLHSCITNIEKIADLMEHHSEEVTIEHAKLWEELKLGINFINFYFEEEEEEDLV